MTLLVNPLLRGNPGKNDFFSPSILLLEPLADDGLCNLGGADSCIKDSV